MMACLDTLFCLVLFGLFCDKSEQQQISLEKRVSSLETQVFMATLKNNQLEATINSLKRTGIQPSGGVLSLNAEKRLDIMENTINDFIKQMMDTKTALVKGLSSEKIETRKIAASLQEIVENQGVEVNDLQGQFEQFLNQFNNEKHTKVRELNDQLKVTVDKLNSTFLNFRQELKATKKEPCPIGWFELEGHCYLYVVNNKKDWFSASLDCIDRSGKLAEPDNIKLMLQLLDVVGDNVWLGGTDEENDGVWFWSGTNERITYFKWIANQPNDMGAKQNCLEVYGDGWNDDNCLVQNDYLCEKTISN